MDTQRDAHVFDADRPIQKSEQDRLGRATFARYLARCILDHDNPESLVIGLYGTWGSGKTSLINLTLEELHSAASNMLDQEKPIILNFSPWSYSGQNQLIYSFFRRLSSELRNAPYLENADRIIHLLELYVSFFTHQPVPKTLRPRHNILTRLLRPQVTKQESFGWEAGRDLTSVKAELNELLRQQKHKIIIIIDNIARIEDQEIRQIFQIVKSMGDYANTIYLLAMDKEYVVQALNHLHADSGTPYLEKIVQLPFEIPAISTQDVENILLDRLKKIVAVTPDGTWDSQYWADIYYSTLKNFFNHSRDVTRYVNTLGFSFLRVKDLVNPVDFFAITTLEVFAPETYYGIRDNKDLFTDLVENVAEMNQQKLNEDKTRIDEIIRRSNKISHHLIQQLLMQLFPRLRRMYEPNTAFYHSEKLARKIHRICSEDIFDLYFRLSIPAGYINDTEMQAILASTQDEEGFALALLRLNQDNRIIPFLSALDTMTVKIAQQDIPSVINALMDGADLFAEGESSPLQVDTPTRIHRIFHQLLRRIDRSEERFDIFSKAIENAVNSIYIIVHELRLQSEEHQETEDTFIPLELRDFTPDQLAQLKQHAVNKIAEWANTNRLQEHPKLIALLIAWKDWSNNEDYQQFVGKITQDDTSLINFLCAALKDPIDQAMTKLQKNADWENSLANIENFISPRILEPHVKMLFEDPSFEKLREREQLAILIFLDLIKANTVKVIPKTSG